MRDVPWLEPRVCPSSYCSSSTTERRLSASARAVATPTIPAPTTTMSASRLTPAILRGLLDSDRGDSPCGPRCGPRCRARKRLVGLGEVARVPGRLRRLDRPYRVGHVGVERFLAVCELRLRDPDPARELPHHLERRDSLAALDAGDVRRAAARERELALADPGGLARGVEPPADGDGIIVMRRSRALEDHRGT